MPPEDRLCIKVLYHFKRKCGLNVMTENASTKTLNFVTQIRCLVFLASFAYQTLVQPVRNNPAELKGARQLSPISNAFPRLKKSHYTIFVYLVYYYSCFTVKTKCMERIVF